MSPRTLAWAMAGVAFANAVAFLVYVLDARMNGSLGGIILAASAVLLLVQVGLAISLREAVRGVAGAQRVRQAAETQFILDEPEQPSVTLP